MHRVDPINAAIRWIQKHPRWIYSVTGPNSLWHNDGLHKLIHWKFVMHACKDGYFRMVTSLVCASDNRAEAALTALLFWSKSIWITGKSSRLLRDWECCNCRVHKQPSRGVLRKRCSEKMQQIYRRTPMPKCDFNKVTKHFGMVVLL